MLSHLPLQQSAPMVHAPSAGLHLQRPSLPHRAVSALALYWQSLSSRQASPLCEKSHVDWNDEASAATGRAFFVRLTRSADIHETARMVEPAVHSPPAQQSSLTSHWPR